MVIIELLVISLPACFGTITDFLAEQAPLCLQFLLSAKRKAVRLVTPFPLTPLLLFTFFPNLKLGKKQNKN